MHVLLRCTIFLELLDTASIHMVIKRCVAIGCSSDSQDMSVAVSVDGLLWLTVNLQEELAATH